MSPENSRTDFWFFNSDSRDLGDLYTRFNLPNSRFCFVRGALFDRFLVSRFEFHANEDVLTPHALDF